MKRKAEDEPLDPEEAHHLGEFAKGDITQLTEGNFPVKKKDPIGFVLDPKAYKKKKKK